MSRFWMLLTYLCWVLKVTHGAKILGLFPLNVKSHSIMTNSIVKELIARGHQLDVITPYPLPFNTSNYTAIDISPGCNYLYELQSVLKVRNVYEMNALSLWETKLGFHIIGYYTTDYALKHENVQRFLHAEDQHYDLILTEQYYQDAFLMFSHKFKAPIISISTFGWNSYFDSMLGSFGAWAHVPHESLIVSDRMTFWQRLQNLYYCLFDKYVRKYVYMTQQQALANKYFSHMPGPHPSLEELSQSVSVILQNSHVPMTTIKPNVPGIIDVGGIHIAPVKPLPQDLKTFLDAAEDGVIYFSFGTQVIGKDMPRAQLSAFQQVFADFSRVKILWKWESDNIDHMPENVLSKKWLPQNDILAHPNVRLFITHGGLLGCQESIYHGVPMLGIPFIGDQHSNINRATLQGYALKLEFTNVTVLSLRWAITELLQNPSYRIKAKRFSQIFRDRPESAMARAVYWIEYVIRYRGADHIRSVGRDLPWYSYFLLDIVATLTVAVLATIVVFWIVLREWRKSYVSSQNCIRKKVM